MWPVCATLAQHRFRAAPSNPDVFASASKRAAGTRTCTSATLQNMCLLVRIIFLHTRVMSNLIVNLMRMRGSVLRKEQWPSCMKTGEKVACRLFNDKSCKTKDHCYFHKHAKECVDIGQLPDCSSHVSKDKCDSLEHCVFHQVTYQCMEAGFIPECEDFKYSSDCVDYACEWNVAVGKCQNPGTVIPCSHFYSEKHCHEAGHCGFDRKRGSCRPLRTARHDEL